eukprot:CAMPEP_0197658162 /NCGR_PEP_ID=MMETSP1338-20131121/45076_1 /TAXON_ID=43686 ORGANISM="Pelagodinium beii, Strain RCC1491" /NCGR_SAMPLE_ID=MMETSP1338 /ASSEMBLY_ACC=CAM_ASM_000754 /LENGTH=116 /DNA_ID=CAMNT_0043234699 /DNA_START=45 /DNA_END=395 /DNA_ORIENTATION=+
MATGSAAKEEESSIANGTTTDENQPSIMELLDELIGLDRSTITKILAFAVSVLLIISSLLIYREVSLGRLHLAAVYGGFVLLVLGLVASVAFVLFEASRLEADANGRSESSCKKSD